MNYKVLPEGRSEWNLPQKKDGSWTPGEWMPALPYEPGYHLCEDVQVISWLNDAIYEAEYRGGRINCDNCFIVREARLLRRFEKWNYKNKRLFACDCAEHVLHIYENEYPGDDRPRKAIETARKYVNGLATIEELDAAHLDTRSVVDVNIDNNNMAVRFAADSFYAAIYSIAGDDIIHINDSAHCAIRAVARAAADAATIDTLAACAVRAYKEEQKWQYEKLKEYIYDK